MTKQFISYWLRIVDANPPFKAMEVDTKLSLRLSELRRIAERAYEQGWTDAKIDQMARTDINGIFGNIFGG